MSSPTPRADLIRLLSADADEYTWAAAVVGSNNAAGYQLAAGAPVTAVGGLNSTDPSPTLDAHFAPQTVDGTVVYDLTRTAPISQPAHSSGQR